ncbi:hypothetical protein F4802DRAFT_21506 [Xylaria palmicola]|nr:hypothetical protein F4802DRAFT_21506 [Xylaria palmicola]
MSFYFSAFNLTPEEKHTSLAEIKTALLQTSGLLQQARREPSPHVYAEAYAEVSQALRLAEDSDACDTSVAPLATCYFYKGEALTGLGLLAEACEAYEKAAVIEPRAWTDIPAARDAVGKLVTLRKLVKIGEAAEKRPSSRTGKGDIVCGRKDDLVWIRGNDEVLVPVKIRRGSHRRAEIRAGARVRRS